MPLDASAQNQLTVILILATLLFIAASALPQKIGSIALLLLAPFQTIDTRFGTSSVVLAYVIFIALVLRKEELRLPLLPQVMFLLLWYLVSMSLMHPSTYMQHGIYMFSLISVFLVMWICYDLTNRFERETSVINVFLIMNVFIAIYCAVQLWIGPGERLMFLGINEMNMTRVRADGRLTGPFESAEITAQYLVLMQFLIIHQYWYFSPGWARRALLLLAVVNLALIVATGSRGEFLLLVGGAGLYLFMFRQRLGVAKATGLAVGGAIALTLTALIVVNFTQFGNLFERIEDTEFTEKGIPDTRQYYWPAAWEGIVESPIIGHGPRFRFFDEHRGARYEHHEFLQFPHSLYLFLLYTVGVPGLALFLWLLTSIMYRCWRSMKEKRASLYDTDLVRSGFLIVLLFLIDGIKIDQMRLHLIDYTHFFFGLCGVFLAVTDRVAANSHGINEGVDEHHDHGARQEEGSHNTDIYRVRTRKVDSDEIN
jgi:O-antigen ligase